MTLEPHLALLVVFSVQPVLHQHQIAYLVLEIELQHQLVVVLVVN